MRASAVFLLAPLLAVGCTAHRQAGTGDVAFRLVWDGTSDLDLLVEDPAASCIFWGQRESGLGGLLDVDCNAGTDRLCAHPIENVYWPTATAPPGAYRVWVHAHALLPAESPLRYELQVLHGPTVSWRQEGRMTEHQELHGPFLHTFPGGEVARAPQPEPLPEACRAPWMRRSGTPERSP